jgi:hypothetical protein
MQIELDLQTSQGNLGRRVTGLHVERPLETAMEVACKILVKLVEVSDRFDILSNSGNDRRSLTLGGWAPANASRRPRCKSLGLQCISFAARMPTIAHHLG